MKLITVEYLDGEIEEYFVLDDSIQEGVIILVCKARTIVIPINAIKRVKAEEQNEPAT